jgi:hypothetical protein
MIFREQAENCRRQASEFAGRPEAPFLLSVANVFEELAIDTEGARHGAEGRLRNSTGRIPA